MQIFYDIEDVEHCGEENQNQKMKKLRLPDTTVFIDRHEQNHDSPPYGRFAQYTWSLTSIFQVKKVFDVEGMIELEITRKFIKTKKVRNNINLLYKLFIYYI